MLVEGWLQRAARLAPARTALETPLDSWSYAELLAAAGAGAEELEARGVERSRRVAIALPGGLAFVQALHACLLLGAVAVPLDPRAPRVERERLAAGAALVLDEPLGFTGADAERAARPRTARSVQHDLDAPAVVMHTSGTSALPRPVVLSYGNLLWSALGSAVALGLDPEERWLCAMPVCHVGGLSILVRSAVYGSTALLHERFETEPVLHALRERGVTLVSLVATTLARLLDAGLEGPPTLRCALTGGGPVPGALLTRAHAAGVAVAQTYGLTEAGSQVTTTPLAAIGAGEAGAGAPLFCTQVRIAPDGEILVRGPTVARGSRAPDGWLHTGDLGDLDGEGRLTVRGRKGDTIITGGENVAPAEVEAVLETHPGVLEAAVVGREDERWGERVTAIVVARAGHTLESEQLRAHCARSLAPYKVPHQIVLASEPLARTPSGKLLRGALR